MKSECQQEMMAAGGAYPRSCPTCGLGPCSKCLVEPTEPGAAAAEDEAFARGLASIATPGEWYVWGDEEAGLVQLMSRTHGSITGRIPLSPQTRGDLMAAAAAINFIRTGKR